MQRTAWRVVKVTTKIYTMTKEIADYTDYAEKLKETATEDIENAEKEIINYQ